MNSHTHPKILVAGIGNIFLGDDAFGCEVIRQLAQATLPEGVRVEDFGIRGYDLACALTGEYDAFILVDAAPRGQAPGTVFLIEPDVGSLESLEPAAVDPHSLDPMRVLQTAKAMGARLAQLYLVGCEPMSLTAEQGQMGLSEPVRAAVPEAVRQVESFVRKLLEQTQNREAGLAPA